MCSDGSPRVFQFGLIEVQCLHPGGVAQSDQGSVNIRVLIHSLEQKNQIALMRGNGPNSQSVRVETMMPARQKSSRKTGTLHQSQLLVVTIALTQGQLFPDELQYIFP